MRKLLYIPVLLIMADSTLGQITAPPPDDYSEYNSKYHLIVKDIIVLGRETPQKTITEMRDLYVKTEYYRPYRSLEKDDSAALFQAIDAKGWSDCLTVSRKILNYNYSSLSGHFGAYICSKRIDKKRVAYYHLFVFYALMDAIGKDRDGRSKETAFETYSVLELKTFLRFSDYKYISQRMDSGNGKVFDVIKVEERKSGERFVLFFDITKQSIKGLERASKKTGD